MVGAPRRDASVTALGYSENKPARTSCLDSGPVRMRPMIRLIPVLSEQQCTEVAHVVHRLRASWIPRGPTASRSRFFTLGAAGYLDGSRSRSSPEHYMQAAERFNPVLSRHFSWLYHLLRDRLEEELDTPTAYVEGFALPGFHVWLPGGIPTGPTSVHFDLQYRDLPWEPRFSLDFDRTISFTLAIKLPGCGGGVDLWDFSYAQARADARQTGTLGIAEAQQVLPMTHVAYRTGALCLTVGTFLHRITQIARVGSSDERLTVQGHGVQETNGTWLLYW